MLAVSSEVCRARAKECLRHAANGRMPPELREHWRRLAEMWRAWAAEAGNKPRDWDSLSGCGSTSPTDKESAAAFRQGQAAEGN
jgi:hypothetical protein